MDMFTNTTYEYKDPLSGLFYDEGRCNNDSEKMLIRERITDKYYLVSDNQGNYYIKHLDELKTKILRSRDKKV